jgi:signal transduction histidine kinase/CheY-like chemotaxis protein
MAWWRASQSEIQQPRARSAMLRRASVLCIAVLFVLFGWFAFDTLNDYHETVANAEEKTLLTARALAQHAESVFENVTASLDAMDRGVIYDLKSSDPEKVLLHAAIRQALAISNFIDDIFVFDPSGRFVASNKENPALLQEVAQGGLATPGLARVEQSVEYLNVVIDRSTARRLLLARRTIIDGDGHVAGVVVAAISLRVFERIYNALILGRDGAIALCRSDGLLLVRAPYQEGLVNKALTGPLFAIHLPKASSGTFWGALQTDGNVRVVGYAMVRGFPLVVAVGLPASEVMEAWRHSFTGDVITFLLAVSVLALLLALVYRLFRQGEKALEIARERGDQFARLVTNVPGVVYTRRLGADGTITWPYLSPRLREVFGIGPAAEIDLSKLVFDRIHRDDRRGFIDSLKISADTLARWQHEFRIVLPGGDVRWVRSQAQPYRTPKGDTAWDGIVFDITEHKRRDEQLRQAQKMETVGQLTGGMAHDFNNLLTVILGNVELLTEALAGDPRLKALAEMTGEAAQRGADLTANLLAFSRKQPLAPRITDINRLVARVDELLRGTLGEHISIVLALAGDLSHATVDPAQLEAAILNLAVNARDAMPEGGKLTIATANAELNGDDAWREKGALSGPYVMVSVSDTGTGMTPEVQAKAFDPFFTTKDVGQGTGLGLSMVYGFVKQSHGHIQLHSEVGRGTTLKLYLPCSTDVDSPDITASAPAEGAGGSETVLIVEDDEMVRAHAQGQIEGLGYRVMSARNGAEALKILRQGQHVDVLFTDMVMPGGMTGRKLAEQARRLRAGLKVLYTSGYADETILHQCKLEPGVDLLGKPYRLRDLAAKLRAVLDGPARRGRPSMGSISAVRVVPGGVETHR